MPHVILLGDSIFDNAAYVETGSAVIDHLRQVLPANWDATLLAVDGATTSVIDKQIQRLPDTATHLVVSIGGNDALWMSGNLYPESAVDVRESLKKLGEHFQPFRTTYDHLIRKLKTTRLPLAVCTIYDSIPDLELPELTGLCVFNDTISRTAFFHRVPLIDLRVICHEASDYSEVSSIEPSSSGGLKIARAISAAVQGTHPVIVG